MKFKIFIIFFISFIFFFVSNAFATSYHKHHSGKKHLILNLIGTGYMYPDLVPDIDGDGEEDEAMCFDVDLVNAKTQKRIGTATDCLSQVQMVGAGVKLVGTSYFHMKRGTLITRGNTSVQPVFHPTVTPDGQSITHITGASSAENSVIGGTFRFANRTGTVRLSGMVDMSNFGGNEGDPITFDCLFVIELERRHKHRW